MGVVELFYGLVLAHFIADYMQPAALVEWTKRTGRGLYVHVGVYTVLTAVVLYGYGGNLWIPVLIVMSLTHFLFDKLKYSLGDQTAGHYLWSFLLDQALHGLVIIAATAYLAAATAGQIDFPPFIRLTAPYVRALIGTTCVIGAGFGGSILVFEALRTFAPADDGKIITFRDRLPGILERSAAGIFLFLTPLLWLTPLALGFSLARSFFNRKDVGNRRAMVEFIAGLVGFGMAAALYYGRYLV
ncbi:MAG: DUF3307 domain-containing protein [Actinomycetota bacterium]